jgi:FkbM family methyltransferase
VSLVNSLRDLVPRPLRQRLKKYILRDRLADLIASHLPSCICIDVGASYYPHGKWKLFLASAQTTWIAVEPNDENIGYVKTWPWPSTVRAVNIGLSREGGKKTLFKTNTDSGSSLLEPVINDAMRHRVGKKDLDYYFPMRKLEIDTTTLCSVVATDSNQSPMFIKLDTQGTELSILQGAAELFEKNRIVGIEMESTLLANPIMKGSGKFWEAAKYLEELGFELLEIVPICAQSGLDIAAPRGKRYLNECDAIFAIRRDIAKMLPINYRIALFTFYLTNKFYEESLSLLADDACIRDYFENKHVDVINLRKIITNRA